jgi:hypothetical protein
MKCRIHAITHVTALLVLTAGPALAQQWPFRSPKQEGKSPLKVFILAGQSNMEGQGIIGGDKKGTLETLLKDPASAPRYKHLADAGGTWVVRDDVWITYNGNRGGLTVGGFAAKGCIGPELGFGWVVGDFLKEPVMLIKFGWGGTSLAQNWRPPGSGGTVGDCYTRMIDGVKEQLKSLKAEYPAYDGKGYEIAGFGWHQGWQDGCAQNMADEYEKNMVNFIRGVRKEFEVPKMPFVIGGSGFGGWEQANGRRLKIMAAQEAAARQAEFSDNVRYVETRDFYRAEDLSPHKFRYHWNGNAETYYLIGDGMGKAMVELLGGPKAPPNPTGPSGKK